MRKLRCIASVHARFLLLIMLFMGSARILANPIYILPDSLEIRTVAGQADFTVSWDKGAYVASIVFEPSYKEIFSVYARDGVPLFNLVKLPLEYLNGKVLFDDSLGLLFKKTEFSTNASQVALTIHFNPGLDEKSVRNLLLTNSIFGFVQATVQCADAEDEFYCGFPVPDLALKNQFRQVTLSSAQKIQRREYIALVDYKNQALLGDEGLFGEKSLDERTRATLRLPGCVGLDPYSKSICGIIKKYSPSCRLSEAIRKLIVIIFDGMDPMQQELLTSSWFQPIAAFHDEEAINGIKDANCYELSRVVDRLVHDRISPAVYSLGKPNQRCSILASGRYFIDLKFADERSLHVNDSLWGFGIDAILRITSFGCRTKVFNIEGTGMDSIYTLPPPPYFACTGADTNSTHCAYSPEERRAFDLECSKLANEILSSSNGQPLEAMQLSQ